MPRHRFHCRHHPILDNASEFDREELNPWDVTFECDLRRDMASLSLGDLNLHYPELIFRRARGKPEKGHAFKETSGKMHTYADWKTAPNATTPQSPS